MSDSFKIGRRTFLVGQAAALGAIGTGTASASVGSANWRTADSRHIKGLVGDTFEGRDADGHAFAMKLVRIDKVKSDRARPASLVRREGLSLYFESDRAEAIAASGGELATISHPALGAGLVYLDTEPKRRGGYRIELVMN